MGTAVRPAKTSPGPWDASGDVDVFVDEVLAVGDAAFQKKCLGKMHDVANSGRTIVLVCSGGNISPAQLLSLWAHQLFGVLSLS